MNYSFKKFLSLKPRESVSVLGAQYFLIFFALSFLLYIFAPSEYSLHFCRWVTILFLVQVVPFIIKISRGNYANFYTLFLFSFFFVNFFYPTILFPINPEMFPVFTLPFNDSYINKGTALAQLSASSFMLGVQCFKSKKQYFYLPNFISHIPTTKIALLLFLVFLLTVGEEFLAGNFTAHSIVSLYVNVLLSCMFILSPIIFFRNFKLQKQKWLFYLTAAVYVFLFLSIGDRGPALSLIITIIGLYSFYVKKIPIKYLLVLGIAGFILMHIVGIGRVTSIYDAEGNIIARGLEKAKTEFVYSTFYGTTESFVVNNRNLYVGMEFVEENGINWGKTSILVSILSIFPFVQSAFEKLVGVDLQTSAYFFTELAFGKNPSYGLGTNLVADIYISFGLIGCIISFYLLGRIVEFSRTRVLSKNDIYSNIIYFALLSNSIYYPRTGIFDPIRNIIWTSVIYFLLKKSKLLRINYIN